MVWGSPHEQTGDFASLHLYKEALHGRVPVQKWFNSDHEQQGRSKPGCREVGSSTTAQFITDADCQSSVDSEFISTEDKSNQMGCRDDYRWNGWLKASTWTGQSWWLSILHDMLSTAHFQRRFGGGVLASTASCFLKNVCMGDRAGTTVGRRSVLLHHYTTLVIIYHTRIDNNTAFCKDTGKHTRISDWQNSQHCWYIPYYHQHTLPSTLFVAASVKWKCFPYAQLQNPVKSKYQE